MHHFLIQNNIMAEVYGIGINVEGNAVAEMKKIETGIGSINSKRIKELSVPIDLDKSKFQKQINDLKSKILSISLDPKIDSKDAKKQIKALKDQISTLKLTADVNTSAAKAKLKELQIKRTIEIEPKIKSEGGFASMGGAFESFKSITLGSLAAKGIESVIESVKEAASEIYNLGVQNEQTRLSFEVLLGSGEKGKEFYNSVRQWADKTPYTHQMAYEQAKLMLNYGADSKQVTHYLEMIGSVAGGSNEKFQRLTYSFSQAIATGKLTGLELKEMTMAGFNPLKILEGTDIAKGSQKVQEIQKKLHQLQIGTGSSAEKKLEKERLKEELEKAQGLNVEYEKMKAQIKEGSFSFDMLVTAYEKATSAGGRFAGMNVQMADTVGGLSSTLESYIAGIGVGIFERFAPLLKDIYNESIKVAQSFATWITPKESDVLKDMQTEMNAMFGILESGNLTLNQAKDVREKINATYKDYLPSLLTEQTTLGEILTIQDKANVSLTTNIELMVKKEITSQLASDVQAKKMELTDFMRIQEKMRTGARLTTGEMLFKTGALGAPNVVGASMLDILTMGQYGVTEKILKTQGGKNVKGGEIAYREALIKQAENMGFKSGLLEMLSTSDIEKRVNLKQTLTPVISPKETPIVNPLITSANNDAMMGAHGGLGESKVINITINKMQEINANKIDSKDIETDGLKAIEEMIRVINNLAVGQGVM
jgi:hypothetical protein